VRNKASDIRFPLISLKLLRSGCKASRFSIYQGKVQCFRCSLCLFSRIRKKVTKKFVVSRNEILKTEFRNPSIPKGESKSWDSWFSSSKYSWSIAISERKPKKANFWSFSQWYAWKMSVFTWAYDRIHRKRNWKFISTVRWRYISRHWEDILENESEF
jgi:hypothetical protein